MSDWQFAADSFSPHDSHTTTIRQRTYELTTRLDDLRRCFQSHTPELSGDSVKIEASVALVLCEEGEDLSLLFIQRATHKSDRWSGHIAFPGGRLDAQDATSQQAAERETREEVGFALDDSKLIGRLDDLRGLSESILVSGYVYGLAQRPPLAPNHEVQNAFWLSLGEIESQERNVERAFDYKGTDFVLPAIQVLDQDDPVLWGISYRFLELLMELVGRPIAPMPWMPNL
jgi:8-oxo-dGTP pyrophosphatase MutT (NUDIX family)